MLLHFKGHTHKCFLMFLYRHWCSFFLFLFNFHCNSTPLYLFFQLCPEKGISFKFESFILLDKQLVSCFSSFAVAVTRPGIGLTDSRIFPLITLTPFSWPVCCLRRIEVIHSRIWSYANKSGKKLRETAKGKIEFCGDCWVYLCKIFYWRCSFSSREQKIPCIVFLYKVCSVRFVGATWTFNSTIPYCAVPER